MIALIAKQPVGTHWLFLTAILLFTVLAIIEWWDRRREPLRERRARATAGYREVKDSVEMSVHAPDRPAES